MKQLPTQVRDTLLKVVQRSRERHAPPIVNRAVFRWPTSSPSPAGLIVEELEYYVEEGAQGWVPLRIIRPVDEPAPVAVQVSEAGASPQAESSATGPQASTEAPTPAPGGGHTPHTGGVSPTQVHADLAAEGSTASAATGAELTGEAAAEVAAAAAAAARRQQQAGGGRVRRPLLIFMHATGENMDIVRPKQELYARMGYFTAAIDARYHGQRAAIPYEVAAALNASVPNAAAPGPPKAAQSGISVASSAAPEPPPAVRELVATVKGLSTQTLEALARADAAAGLGPEGGSVRGGAPSREFSLPEFSLRQVGPGGVISAAASSTRLPLPLPPAPAGSRTAAAEARQEAEAEARRQAHQRFVAAWVACMAEFKDRRGAEAATAVLATAPATPAPGLAGGGSGRWAQQHRGAVAALADRATARMVYEIALMAAWRGSGEQPLFLDTVWDLVLLLDVLAVRGDVDMQRVGVTGFSMGGSITWLWSVIDARISVAAPVAGVQGFRWAIDNESYHARVGRYPLVFELAASDLRGGKGAQVDAEVVTAVWNKLLPGLLVVYDAPLSLPSIALRPLLVITGELDQSCPQPGVDAAAENARAPYLEWALEERRKQVEAEAEERARAAEADGDADDKRAAEGEAGDEGGNGGWRAAGEGEGEERGGDAGPRREGSELVGAEPAQGSGLVQEEASQGSESGAARRRAEDAGVAAGALEEAETAAVAAMAAGAEEAVVFAEEEAEAAEAAALAAAKAAEAAAEAARLDAERRERLAVEELLATKYKYIVELGVGHTETGGMQRAVQDWMNAHLLYPWRKAQQADTLAGK